MKIPTKNIVRSCAVAAFMLTLIVGCSAQTKRSQSSRWSWQKHQAEVIAYAKKYLVSDIESNVPQVSFEKWFQTTVGEDEKVDWEINDCGEQTGTSADRRRDFPMCVSANNVKPQFIETRVNIQFGTFSRGIIKMKPVVRSIVAEDEIGSEWVNNLSDLLTVIKLQEKTRRYFNPNRGSFQLSENPPAGFEKFNEMWIHTAEYDENGKYIPVTAKGGMLVGKIFYKVKGYYSDRKVWRLETLKVDGVSYKFDGEFAKLNFDADGAATAAGKILQGHLIKIVNGAKAAEADLSFDFAVSQKPLVPGQSLKISEIKKLNPATGVFTTRGFVVINRACPLCPPERFCKPCENRILISEEKKQLDTYEITGKEMIIAAENPQEFVKGKEYIFKIKVIAGKSTGDSLNDAHLIGYSIVE